MDKFDGPANFIKTFSEGMVKNKNDGGPAFPYSALTPEGPQMYTDSEGMSLRDYFAAKAMQAELSTQSRDGNNNYILDSTTEFEWLAERSYEISDAMLKAREE